MVQNRSQDEQGFEECHPTNLEDLPETIKGFLIKCFQFYPEERPTAGKLLKEDQFRLVS